MSDPSPWLWFLFSTSAVVLVLRFLFFPEDTDHATPPDL
jgi:hypothetical protein